MQQKIRPSIPISITEQLWNFNCWAILWLGKKCCGGSEYLSSWLWGRLSYKNVHVRKLEVLSSKLAGSRSRSWCCQQRTQKKKKEKDHQFLFRSKWCLLQYNLHNYRVRNHEAVFKLKIMWKSQFDGHLHQYVSAHEQIFCTMIEFHWTLGIGVCLVLTLKGVCLPWNPTICETLSTAW